MEFQRLGRTDLRLSRVVFGSWAVGGHGWGAVDDRESEQSIREALDLGVNFFDTADVYGFGHSEEILAKALGPRRHDVIIATKFGVTWDANGKVGRSAAGAYVRKAVEDSLRRLRLESLVLYQVHWPDPDTPIEETMEALLRCQEQGKIRHIGFSNFAYPLIGQGQAVGRAETLQVPFSILRREAQSTAEQSAQAFGMSVLTYDVLAKGLLTGKFNEETVFSIDDVRSRDPEFTGDRFRRNLQIASLLKHLGAKYNKTAAQVAIRWILDHPIKPFAIVGVKTPQQMRDNASVDWELDRDDWGLIDGALDIANNRP